MVLCVACHLSVSTSTKDQTISGLSNMSLTVPLDRLCENVLLNMIYCIFKDKQLN